MTGDDKKHSEAFRALQKAGLTIVVRKGGEYREVVDDSQLEEARAVLSDPALKQ